MNHAVGTNVKLINFCPLCTSSNFLPVLKERNHFPNNMHEEVKIFNNTWLTLLECQECSFGFTQEIPTSPTFFTNLYDNNWYNPEQELVSDRKKDILDDIFLSLSQLGCSSGNLLDVGSFAGQLLKKGSECGFVPTGVEINPTMANHTKKTLGFEVICSDFQSLSLQEGKYQVITLIDVLEHLVEPKEVLQKLSYGLDRGGLLVIKVPNYPMQKIKQKLANWLKISDEGIFASFAHVNHFSISSMEKVLKSLDLELIHVDVAHSEKWTSNSLINRRKNFCRNLYCRFSKLVNIRLGLNICYYAKKK